MKKPNDIIIKNVTRVAIVIILAFAINLFISGHHHPGGGFIGGLAFSSALILLFLTFDMESVRRNLPVDFKVLSAVGVLIAVLTGVGEWCSISRSYSRPMITSTSPSSVRRSLPLPSCLI